MKERFFCLGICIVKSGPRKFTLTQTDMITMVLKEENLESCNTATTLCSTVALVKDEEGGPFNESWEYATVAGMLVYLSKNSRPSIAYDVNQCVRFTNCPKSSHTLGLKIILRYLKGVREKGMDINPTGSYSVDCFVDSDSSRLLNSDNDQDPICVKSRARFVIMLIGCPLQL